MTGSLSWLYQDPISCMRRLARVSAADSAELTMDWWTSQSQGRPGSHHSKVWLMGCSLLGFVLCLSKAFVVLLPARGCLYIFYFFGFSVVESFVYFWVYWSHA